MTPEMSVELISSAVYTIIKLILVLIVPGLILGIIVAIIQGATSIQEQTLTFLPRMILTLLMIVFAGHWMLQVMIDWFEKLKYMLPGVFG
ncbi:flagellar biosynthetic protein FliQ [Pseudoalteromonas sp. JB197]|uniref:flagellar biosynthetic protein FliQ n=1 Tax=Pseudoalteromonas sp. JB197 TaxID=1434839 RepID=UPI00097E92CF|nr:flagellar biosynthetic protein FliQ [Pseudoalteromonas sp. JB197]PCC12266.1 flagellar type III secretion system protein FliQ [Pseudoalteromonas sp. JB197]SJN48891.1 Flagellar biosynthesis protein FliQ [Pseudoalteromonas sp. JB197]